MAVVIESFSSPATTNTNFTVGSVVKGVMFVSAASAVSIDGVAMTQLTAFPYLGTWYYKINPTAGSRNITSAANINHIVLVSNVNQTTPFFSSGVNVYSSGQTASTNYQYSYTITESYLYPPRVIVDTVTAGGVSPGAFTFSAGAKLIDFGASNSNVVYTTSTSSIGGYYPLWIRESLPSASISGVTSTNLTYKSATLNATVNGNGYSTNSYIEYGLTTSYGTVLATQATGTGAGAYSQTATGLTANTLYHFRVVGDNGNGIEVGSDFTFTTLPTPTTTTSSASSITANSATLNGFVTNGNVAGNHYFQYGITTGIYTNTTTSTSNTANSSQQAISGSIAGLTTSVPIFYRSVMIVDGVTYNGAEQTFIPGNAPILSLTANTLLTDTTVTFNGLVNPGGLATNYQFQYGTTVSLGTNTTLTSAGAGITDVSVNSPITGLLQNTTYYYRLTAVNGGGTNNTSTNSFITNGDAVITSFSVEDAVVYTTNVFNFTQEINDTSGTYVIDYGIAPATYTLQITGNITADGTITNNVSGLLPNKTYYARLSITNSFGTVMSSEISFSTFASPFTTVWSNTDLEPTTVWVNQNI